MAIDYQTACMLWEARERGVSFARTATLAHLSLFLHRGEVKRLQRRHHQRFPEAQVRPLTRYQWGEYSDTFLREFLGVDTLTIIDYSAYEGADTVHDFNQPLPANLRGKFDAVIDGGSLEHIFNVPVALGNLMELARVGGTVFLATPANNCCGHGFYQFSPELMFRVFTPANGFELPRLVMCEAEFPSGERTPNRKVYAVANPEEVRSRVMLVGRRPVSMLVEARKAAQTVLFAQPPLQSDYVSLWQTEGANAFAPRSSILQTLLGLLGKLPRGVDARIRGYGELFYYSLCNRRFYKRLRR